MNQLLHILSPGSYYLGDPCYIWPDLSWTDFCKKSDNLGLFEKTYEIIMTEQGFNFLVFGTAHGDGTYTVMKNEIPLADIGVDSGLLSVIPVSLISLLRPDLKWFDLLLKIEESGCLIEILTVTQIEKVSKGHIKCPPFEINTDYSENF